MSKEWNRQILEMLRDSGAVELPHGGGHHRFRLPNGHNFFTAKTPSDTRGVKNDLAILRRELRSTHPEIAMRGRSLSKEKMATYAMAVVNKPGDKPIPLESPTYAEITGTTKRYMATMVPIADFFPPLPASPIQALERGDITELAMFPNAPIPTHFIPIRIEDKEMLSLLSRAHLALGEVKTRLASYNEQICYLKIQQDADIEKQLKLEEYINRQEAIAREAAELVDFGVIPPEPVAQPVVEESKEKRKPGTRMPVGLVYNTIFPAFRSHFNGNGFSASELQSELETYGYGHFDRKTVANWLGNDVRRPETVLTRVDKGRYGFKKEETHETPVA